MRYSRKIHRTPISFFAHIQQYYSSQLYIAKRKYFTHVFLNHRCLDVMEYVNTDVYFTRLQVFHSIVCHHQTIQAYRFLKIYLSKNVALLWLLDKLPASAFAPDFLDLCNAKTSKYFINPL